MGILNVTPDSFYDGGEYEKLNSNDISLKYKYCDGNWEVQHIRLLCQNCLGR